MRKRQQAKRAKVGKPQTCSFAHSSAADLAERLEHLDVESVGLDHARTRKRGRHSEPAVELIMAARLSERLGISTVTLWRWRHDEHLGFPKGRRINQRIYFPLDEVAAWLERQQRTA
jgi:predicted DNA-binding transcriptional regulator AlpA